ncbi:MAG TPA: aspartate carbamoyltransferase regulatory subunit [Candidatus Thermoplasmatota archaeon]|nr:aspartate carbamoyltransferase regulatory subunit [Candidatus Thermoplasmatota archaeon]
MKELKVQPIRNGTVIDHITPGRAIKVLKILQMPRTGWTSVITAAMNVPSSKGRKDILKIEDRELDTAEVNKISLIAPNATINIVREYEVIRKDVVQLPEKVSGLVKCPNQNCVTNSEPVTSQFLVTAREPLRLRCGYCDREVADVADHIV